MGYDENPDRGRRPEYEKSHKRYAKNGLASRAHVIGDQTLHGTGVWDGRDRQCPLSTTRTGGGTTMRSKLDAQR
jgi:hypothetical protein